MPVSALAVVDAIAVDGVTICVVSVSGGAVYWFRCDLDVDVSSAGCVFDVVVPVVVVDVTSCEVCGYGDNDPKTLSVCCMSTVVSVEVIGIDAIRIVVRVF